MRFGIIAILALLLAMAQVSALTATVQTYKVIVRAPGPGTYNGTLSVRNDNNITVAVSVSGADNKTLFIDNPVVTLGPGEEYAFNTRFVVTDPINQSFPLSVLFKSDTQAVSLNAQWVLFSEFAKPTVVDTSTGGGSKKPSSHASGGSSGTSYYVPAPKKNATNATESAPKANVTVPDPKAPNTSLPVIEPAPKSMNATPILTATGDITPVTPQDKSVLYGGIALIALMIAGILFLLFRKEEKKNEDS